MTRFLKSASLLLLAAPLFAGGIMLDFGNPKASSDAAAQGALMTVRLIDCQGNEHNQGIISGTAEGLVNGKRISTPLRIVPLSKAGMYAVQFERPQEGTWVLAFQVRINEHAGTVIEPLNNSGYDRKPKLLDFNGRAETADAALRKLASGRALSASK